MLDKAKAAAEVLPDQSSGSKEENEACTDEATAAEHKSQIQSYDDVRRLTRDLEPSRIGSMICDPELIAHTSAFRCSVSMLKSRKLLRLRF